MTASPEQYFSILNLEINVFSFNETYLENVFLSFKEISYKWYGFKITSNIFHGAE